MPALWTTPSTGLNNPKVISGINMDINRLLACERIPTSNNDDENPADIGASIANQLFVAPQSERVLDGGNFHYNPAFRNTRGVALLCPFAYLCSGKDEEAFALRKLTLAIKQGPDNWQVGKSYNSTTLSVQWNGARAVDKVTFLTPAVIDGIRFKYQFRTDINTGPAEVAAALSAALDIDHARSRQGPSPASHADGQGL
ncbi:hypothetical protein F5Y14DRAFT_449642 [Nemania sp. NC0429]|nr:hypothetical protein F5Y14DRAFT_449642 [Nemania sp. NC0429]